jgi:hypothetical protein
VLPGTSQATTAAAADSTITEARIAVTRRIPVIFLDVFAIMLNTFPNVICAKDKKAHE